MDQQEVKTSMMKSFTPKSTLNGKEHGASQALHLATHLEEKRGQERRHPHFIKPFFQANHGEPEKL